jgi:exodeoxyribonuclease V alpha subunit
MNARPGFGDVALAARDLVARRFASAVGRLHLGGGGEPQAFATIESCAARCWRAAQEHGHSCIAVDQDDLAVLAASPAVAPAARAVEGSAERRDAALVLEGGHLFLERLWRAEWRLAQRLLELAEPAPLVPAERISAEIAAVFGNADADDAQQRAVTLAFSRRLTVISGGPGTGKTTTLARLIAVYSRLVPEGRIAIAAPTGKAAARVSEALHAQLAELAVANAPASAKFPGATTLHRLLGLRGAGSRPSFGRDRPLPFDLVVVDEASMVDLELASALVTAVGAHARLVLSGDRDQLASVEAGAVFAALCAARDERLRGGVVALERNYRQRETPEIVHWAQAARAGTMAVADLGDSAGKVCLRRLAGAGGSDQAALGRTALAGYAPALELLGREGGSAAVAAELLGHLAGYRVLCALRRGPLGVEALNRVVAAAARLAVGAEADATWYPGRFVIVSRNTPELGLFNGDTGVCLRRAGTLAVAFPLAARLHWVAVAQMPACADAFALTVHQSQGSEFDQVTLVAAPAGHRLATRELIYTGITRARLKLEIFAGEGALSDAAGRVTERTGLLGWRLAGDAP